MMCVFVHLLGITQLNQKITHQYLAMSNTFDFEITSFPAALFHVGHIIQGYQFILIIQRLVRQDTQTFKGEPTHRPTGK